MKIEEIREKKRELEIGIKSLINRFEIETGLIVKTIEKKSVTYSIDTGPLFFETVIETEVRL